MNDERMTYYTLMRSAERGYASPGQLRRLDELAEKYAHEERVAPIVDDFDRVGEKFRKTDREAEKARALREFDAIGRRG
jgi:hypothetical protein